MNINKYISKIEFDKYEIYYRENKNFETVLLDSGDNSKLLSANNGQELSNGIIDQKGINPTFKLIFSANDTQFIQSLIQDEKVNFFPNRRIALYDTAIIFYKNGWDI